MNRLGLLLLLAAASAAAQPASQNVSVIIPLARVFDVDDNDVTLAFASPTPTGYAPVTAASSYDISVSQPVVAGVLGTYKITVHTAASFAAGLSVSAEMAPASSGANGGTSTGAQAIPVGAASAVALVTGIRKVNGRGRLITYRATADLTTPTGAHARTVIYTLIAE